MKNTLTMCLISIMPLTLAAADAPTGPAVTIELADRQAQAVPTRFGCHHTGGGNIDVQQPSPDVVVVTMTGVAVAVAHPCKDSFAGLAADLTQDFDVCFTTRDVKHAKLTMEARLIGLLRSHKFGGGSASVNCPAHAFVLPCGFPGAMPALAEASLPGRGVACGENLSINDKFGPMVAPINPGRYTLRQTFGIQAAHPAHFWPCKASSAEFAPDPALDPLWISYWEPFHGANKKDFGFQVIIRVTPVNGPNGMNGPNKP